MNFDPNDDIHDSQNEPMDEKGNFLDKMRELFETDPDEAVARLEEAGYTVDDLEL